MGGRHRRATRSRARSTVLRVAYVVDGVGAAARALELAVEYAKERVQFDKPIGAFQAVQHLCADMLRTVELGRAAGLLRVLGGGRRRPPPKRTAPRRSRPRSRARRSRSSAAPRSRCSAASGSRGSTTSTSSTSVSSRCRSRSAPPTTTSPSSPPSPSTPDPFQFGDNRRPLSGRRSSPET